MQYFAEGVTVRTQLTGYDTCIFSLDCVRAACLLLLTGSRSPWIWTNRKHKVVPPPFQAALTRVLLQIYIFSKSQIQYSSKLLFNLSQRKAGLKFHWRVLKWCDKTVDKYSLIFPIRKWIISALAEFHRYLLWAVF